MATATSSSTGGLEHRGRTSAVGSGGPTASTSTAPVGSDRGPGRLPVCVGHQLGAGGQHQLGRLERRHRPAQATDHRHAAVHVGQPNSAVTVVPAAGTSASRARVTTPERALAAAQQAGEVVARVVLDQPAEVGDDLAGAEHGLHAEQLPAGGAVSQHPEAAGVGGDRAADGGAVARGEVDAVAPAGIRCAAACTAAMVVPAPAVSWPASASTSLMPTERAGRQHELTGERHRATHQAGVAALGDDGHPFGVAPTPRPRRPRRRPGAHHRRCRADEAHRSSR